MSADYSAISDETLVKEFLAGEREAFAELYRRYAAPVAGYIYKRKPVSTQEERDELRQEVFTEALALLAAFSEDAYDGDHPFRQWLFNIPVSNVLFMDRKRRWVQRECYLKSADDLAYRVRIDTPTSTSSPALTGKLRTALDALRPHYRQAIELHFVEDLPVRTAAVVMGKDAQSVHSYVRRALEELRNPGKPKIVRGDRRAALLQAARTLLAKSGGRRVTETAIAEAAGCSAGLIRWYFGSKKGLMDEASSSMAVAS